MFNQRFTGSAAPLALLFTLVSMSFTVAYLKNSFSQSAMEKYRYAEWRALYSAEAGLNDVGIIVLPQITSDTLLIPNGFNYGKDENEQPIGLYKDIACSTRFQPNSTRKEYVAYVTGVAEYTTPSGTDVSVERRVYTTMVPQGFEEFMYFTHEEEPIGPGNTGTVNFCSNDALDGKVHTNGELTLCNNCEPGPTFTGEVNITFENEEINMGNCEENVFHDDDGNTILDTVSTIIFPPDNSAEVARQHATSTFTADDKLFRPGKKDTMIMTEINFAPGGYWATQWWYNIPPVGSPPAEYDYLYDSETTGDMDCIDGTMHLGFNNIFDPETNTYNGNFLLMSPRDLSGNNVENEITDLVEDGDLIRIENADGTKFMSFTATTVNPFNEFSFRVSYVQDSFFYFGPDGEGFNPMEPVTFINTSATTGLAENVEWNAPTYYHDHDIAQLDPENWDGFCEAGHRQHFDFDYWTAGGTSCDIFSCPETIYNSEYVYMDPTYFSGGNSPNVIYVKGGQVLVRGTVDGMYTIVTDDYTEYRVHSNSNAIDRVWGNIWLIDDVVYSDSDDEGRVIHPDDGGTENVLGLIAGGSVIIANTRPNGARSEQYGSDIRINAAIMAMHGGFLSHYWQNTTADFHSPTLGGIYNLPIADGRGGHRNHYRHEDQSGLYSINSQGDYRGFVKLWGSIVQFQRGYMKRNQGGGSPYITGHIGYDKNYNYDYNLRLKPPPYFPDMESINNTVILKMASYGEAKSNE